MLTIENLIKAVEKARMAVHCSDVRYGQRDFIDADFLIAALREMEEKG